MTTPRKLKHLPVDQWPAVDRALFDAAFIEGDIFEDNCGAGAHLQAATRTAILFGWRRWLGFLADHHPALLDLPAAERITPPLVHDYLSHLAVTVNQTSVGMAVARLYDAARFVASDCDWTWLKALKSRLLSQAKPQDRFDKLVPPHLTLNLGIALMDAAQVPSSGGHKKQEIQYRDGLILAVLSLWPIRRRSLAALSLSDVEVGIERADILLSAEATKSGRSESWQVPAALLPYLLRYLNEVRHVLLGKRHEPGLWVGGRGNVLGDGSIYAAVRRRTKLAFGTAMALHDFRRSAATFLAIDAPEKVGLIPGILQHATPETGDRHYNLARSAAASRRHSATITELRARLLHTR